MAYVYQHIRLDKNEPFYVGSSSSNNFKRAYTFSKSNRNKIWNDIYDAINGNIKVEILYVNISNDEAYLIEKRLILKYGRIDNNDGILANICAGSYGENISSGVRKEKSDRVKGDKNPFYGKKHTDETKIILRNKSLGSKKGPCPEERRIKISIANKGKTPPLKGKKDPKGSLSRTGVNHSTYKGRVIQLNLEDKVVNIFNCLKDAAVYIGTKDTNMIARVIRGERNYYKGYKYRYEDILT